MPHLDPPLSHCRLGLARCDITPPVGAYLPATDAHGKGIYQESIAMPERGCLERLTEAAAEQMARWK